MMTCSVALADMECGFDSEPTVLRNRPPGGAKPASCAGEELTYDGMSACKARRACRVDPLHCATTKELLSDVPFPGGRQPSETLRSGRTTLRAPQGTATATSGGRRSTRCLLNPAHWVLTRFPPAPCCCTCLATQSMRARMLLRCWALPKLTSSRLAAPAAFDLPLPRSDTRRSLMECMVGAGDGGGHGCRGGAGAVPAGQRHARYRDCALRVPSPWGPPACRRRQVPAVLLPLFTAPLLHSKQLLPTAAVCQVASLEALHSGAMAHDCCVWTIEYATILPTGRMTPWRRW
jgi:hypothetical protein